MINLKMKPFKNKVSAYYIWLKLYLKRIGKFVIKRLIKY